MAKSNSTFIAISALLAVSAAGFGETLINGAGATFPNPIYQKWFSEYNKLHPDVKINYQSLGSGAGIKQVTEGTVDFGATDGPMTDAQLKEFESKRGGMALHFPTVLGAVVLTYNVPGVQTELKLTPELVSNIFLGRVTKWNDPELAKVNPGVKLPANDIVVVHRSDGSGTTYCFTDYLSKISNEWKTKVGTGASPNWPTGLGGKGNDGVTGQIKNMPNSIGYVELVYAEQNKLPYATLKNSSGAFIKPSMASVTAAAAGAVKAMPDDFRVSITDSPGKAAYPISTFTWLLIPSDLKDANKSKILKDFVKWAIGPGQAFTDALAYAKLPTEVVAKETKALAKVK